MDGLVYLDYHATTMADPAVVTEISDCATGAPGNAASRTHAFGREAANRVAASRHLIANLIRGDTAGIVFTSGATESNNVVVLGCGRGANRRFHRITTAAEHRALLDPIQATGDNGWDSTILPVDEYGAVNAEHVAAAIRPNTVLVSVIFANNEVGTINPISEIAKICRERGVLFHTDATQALGKVPIDVSKMPIDLMSVSAHKIYGPKGVGALYLDRETVGDRIQPIMFGGGHEQGLRPGTLPVPLIVGFAKACELCGKFMEDDAGHVGGMRDRLWARFQVDIPNVVLNGHPTNRLYNNLNVSFLGVPSEAFMVKLRDVVAVSAGSACTSANPEPSHVLRAMGIHGDRLDSAIRFGLGRFNTMEEIEYVADHVRDAVAELRRHL